MTIPQEMVGETAASTPTMALPDEAAVMALHIPGDVYVIRVERGQRETLVTQYDLSNARVAGSAVSPSWSDAGLVIETYRLGQLMETCVRILHEMFGGTAVLRPEIERDPESAAPSLIFWLGVPRSMRPLRHEFLERYVRETVIPDGAPVPVLQWEYRDAVPA